MSFGPILAGFFRKLNAGFQWKVELARALGYSDWNTESLLGPLLSNNILHGACEEANVQEVLFALEIAGLDPNLEGVHRRTALGDAASAGFLKGAAILVECGAAVDSSKFSVDGTPLIRSLRYEMCTDVTHYLLLQGAKPQLKNNNGASTWREIWEIASNKYGNKRSSWSFIRLEGELTHLLLHGSDPFELFGDPDPYGPAWVHNYWYASKLRFRAPEIARSWSYGLRRGLEYWASSEEWISSFENAEEMRTPRLVFHWSLSGLIYQQSSGNDRQYSWVTEAAEIYSTPAERPEGDQYYQVSDNTTKNAPDDGKEHSTDAEDKEISSNIDDLEDKDQDSTFFRGQTQFYYHISSSEGRRKLSRFPMALALCDALQFAGYRAELDDEGDIWYEIEDGDRYFDARENHPEEERDNLATEFCPICQDFERYGLGHILEEVADAKRELHEYREKVRTKRNYFC